jgi:hypothetical protein
MTPDPTFYPSPADAAAAPVETHAYVVTLNTGVNSPDRKPDALTVIELEAAARADDDEDWGTPGDPGGPLRLPPSLAIARHLINGWLTD